jgi:hypothetical protein
MSELLDIDRTLAVYGYEVIKKSELADLRAELADAKAERAHYGDVVSEKLLYLEDELVKFRADNISLRIANEIAKPPEIDELRAENARMCAALESLTPGGSEFHDSPQNCLDFVQDRLATAGKVAKERNELRAALERVEWSSDSCPWCHEFKDHGHAQNCQRQAALKGGEK